MISQTRIETMDQLMQDQLMQLMAEQQYRPELKRYRDLQIYRGECNAGFTLSTSLQRNCKGLSRKLEQPMLHNFTKYAVLEEPMIEGFPTRLLDWSFSPLMALHFAATESDLDQMAAHDAVVWRIDIDELHDRLPSKYQKVMEKYATTVFSVDMLREACESLEQYDADMGEDHSETSWTIRTSRSAWCIRDWTACPNGWGVTTMCRSEVPAAFASHRGRGVLLLIG